MSVTKPIALDETLQRVATALETMTENMEPSVVEVTGTTPSITGEANKRYMCGTLTTLSITPPQSGVIDVVFTSGSTPTILTVPSTVLFSGDFDAEDLEANTTYEINIMDGIYGVVASWT